MEANQQLFDNIKSYAITAGRITSKPVVSLFYVLKSEKTSMADKAIIVAALSYLVLPIDLIPNSKIPLLGVIDEYAAVMLVYHKTKKYITPEISAQVEDTLNKWFDN